MASDTVDDSFMDVVLRQEAKALVRQIFLREIGVRLRRTWTGFRLAHFQEIVDELNFDSGLVVIEADATWESTLEVAVVAAAVFGEPATEQFKWKRLLLEDGELVSEADKATILHHVTAMPFIKRAWWKR